MRSGQPAIVASESAGVPSGTDHQAARHARLIVDRVFGVVVEALNEGQPTVRRADAGHGVSRSSAGA